jgi:hypothetical protein
MFCAFCAFTFYLCFLDLSVGPFTLVLLSSWIATHPFDRQLYFCAMLRSGFWFLVFHVFHIFFSLSKEWHDISWRGEGNSQFAYWWVKQKGHKYEIFGRIVYTSPSVVVLIVLLECVSIAPKQVVVKWGYSPSYGFLLFSIMSHPRQDYNNVARLFLLNWPAWGILPPHDILSFHSSLN